MGRRLIWMRLSRCERTRGMWRPRRLLRTTITARGRRFDVDTGLGRHRSGCEL